LGDALHDHVFPSIVLAYKEVVVGVYVQLHKVKCANTATQFATKHAIMDAMVSYHNESFV
jgi:hypothetical protein